MKPIRWILKVLLVLLVLAIFFSSLLILLANPEPVAFATLIVAEPFTAALGQWLLLFFLAGIVLGGLFGFVAGRLLLYAKREKDKRKEVEAKAKALEKEEARLLQQQAQLQQPIEAKLVEHNA